MLGTTFYELCSLKKPFYGDSFPIVIQKIMNEEPLPLPDVYSQCLQNLIKQMLIKNADKRPDINEIIKVPQLS